MPDNFGRMTSSEASRKLQEFCFPKVKSDVPHWQVSEPQELGGQMNYTKGEWEAWDNGLICHREKVGQTLEVGIAIALRASWMSALEANANAHLIAAAPDLLEVADIALDLVQHVLYLHPDDEVAQAQKVIIEKAKAKAEGRV